MAELFGVSLQTAISHSVLGKDGIELPTVFRQCIDYLEENGINILIMISCFCVPVLNVHMPFAM